MNIVDKVKKLMGWCPKSSSYESRKTIRFDDPTIDKPDGGREFTYTASGWWNQYRNRRLLTSIMATLFSVSLFFEGGINKFEIYFAGILVGILVGILEWRTGVRAIDKLALEGAVKYSYKDVIAIVFIIILCPILFWYSMYVLGKEETLAFTSGFLFLIWIKYFEIKYWEKKNCKRLVVQKHRFFTVPFSKRGNLHDHYT
ncbi:MAG: DUF1673 family protein [Candidatus Methanoperedens sp.]|nr:DUF1673 family protein [Candidatus Methanoperedens sp.]